MKSLQILGLGPGVSEEEVRKAYRELAMVWHPDRFADDSPIQARAQEKLREINAAYEYLTNHGTDVSISAAGGESPPEEPPAGAEAEVAPSRRSGLWVGGIVLLLAAAGLTWWLNRARPNGAVLSKSSMTTNVVALAPAAPSQAKTEGPGPAEAAKTAVRSENLLRAMRPLIKCNATQSSEGIILSGDGRFVTDAEYTPPFAMEVIVKTDLTNIRLYFGQGVVILNWEVNPEELRHHDPKTAVAAGVIGKGRIPANEWVTVRWQIDTNRSVIFVNGEERARFSGDYSQLEDLPGIGAAAGSRLTLKHFGVQKSPPANDLPSSSLAAGLVLYFPFDLDTKDTVIDQSGWRNHGKLYGARITSEGKVGAALSLNAQAREAQFVLVPHSSSLVSMQQARQITLAAWIKPRSLPSEYPVILEKGGPFLAAKFAGYELVLDSAARWDMVFESGPYVLKSPGEGPKWFATHMTQWTHVAVVVNGMTARRKLYINGLRVGDEFDERANCTLFKVMSTNALHIGAPDPKNKPNRARFDGLVDEIRIYARALSGEEIRRLPGLAAIQ